MKKYFFLACALVLGAFTFNACGSSDDDPATSLSTPKYSDSAHKFVFTGKPAQDGEGSDLGKASNLYVSQAEFTEGGLFVAKLDENLVKNSSKLHRIATCKDMGDVSQVWVMGNYTVKVEGNVLNLLVGDGELTFTITSDANGNTTSITLNAAQLEEAVTLFANEMKVIANDNTDGNLCRTWKVVKTNLIYTPYENGKAKAAVTKSFNGANLEEISEYLYTVQDLDIREELLKHGPKIEKIAFTKRGSFAIDFANSISMGDWEWTDKSKGVFKYTWYEDDMENEFDGEGATVRFDGNNCVLVLNGKIRESANNKEYTVFLQFTMQAPAQ